MNKKLLSVLAKLSFVSAAVMFAIGSSNGRLTELRDFFWAPIPLGVIFLLLARKK